MKKVEASILALAGGVSYGVLPGLVKKAYAAGVATGPLTTLQNLVGATMLWLLAWGMGRYAKQKQVIADSSQSASPNDWAQSTDILLKTSQAAETTNAVHDTSQPTVAWQQIAKLLLVGFLPGLTGVFYYLALVELPAAIGIVLLFQFTWAGVLLEAFVKRRRPGKFRLLALGCLIPGTWLAVGATNLNSTALSWHGLGLGLLSAFTYAAFLYCTGEVETDVPPWTRSALIITGSLIVNLLVFPPTALTIATLTIPLLVYGALMGIFGPVIPTVCFAYGVRVLCPPRSFSPLIL